MTAKDVAEKLGVARSSIIRWIEQYRDELEKEGIVTIKWGGYLKRIDIDLDRFAKFMEETGAKFSDYRKEE